MEQGIQIRRLGIDDLGFADRVREQAGWNQTLDDWRRLLRLEPEGCFLAELDGQSVGTATTTVYGDNDLAWIGMVLVDESARRRGVGGALLARCISYLRDERKVKCIRLDATPAGQPLYEKLGFVAEWGLQRWQSEVAGGVAQSSLVTAELSNAALQRDVDVFGADRLALLRALEDGAIAKVCDGKGLGDAFGFLRSGSRASYLGPVVAESWAEARVVVERLLLAAPAGLIFWDIPDDQSQARAFAKATGFQPQRQLVRMTLDGVKLDELPQSVFAIAEPALG